MNWSDLAGKVAAAGAPLIGAALGGPLGAAAARLIAEVLGDDAATATPAQIDDALARADPAQLAEAEARWVAMVRAEADTARVGVSETNATMRAEIASVDALQRWWRPVYAFELTLECAVLWTVLVHDFWTHQLAILNALNAAAGLLIAYWGFRFGVLGVYVGARTREKQAAITGDVVPGLIEQLARALARATTGKPATRPPAVVNKKP